MLSVIPREIQVANWNNGTGVGARVEGFVVSSGGGRRVGSGVGGLVGWHAG